MEFDFNKLKQLEKDNNNGSNITTNNHNSIGGETIYNSLPFLYCVEL